MTIEAPPVGCIATDDEAAFMRALSAAQAADAKVEVSDTYIDGKRVVWAPQAGSQVEFMACPLFECLYHGTRGPGKTDSLLMAFVQHVGRGFGGAWRGIIFRETYPQLADVVAKSERWFRQIFPSARFVRAGAAGRGMAWHFETGEVLFFRHMRDPRDYWNYHGHEYPFIGWEELTNWASDACFRSMFACCRSSTPGVPRMIRGTTNPYGRGHNWVKSRYRLSGQWWKTIVTIDATDVDGNLEPPRAAIHGHLSENKILLNADPNYRQTIGAAALNKAMADAWLKGSWDMIAGGMFDDVWDRSKNEVPDFVAPSSWRIDRAFDWGSSKPFSVGWYAESDGSDLTFPNGQVFSTVRGDLFRIGEWYGSTGRPNEGLRMLAVDVSEGIVEREILRGWHVEGRRSSLVHPGPADSSIYTVENGRSIGQDMEKPIRIGTHLYPGATWTRADKRPGSRISGWEECRQIIRGARPKTPGLPRETPGFFVVGSRCPEFLRTILTLPRDERNLDDVDTDSEDHIADEFRYRVRSSGSRISSGTTVGMT